MSVRSRQRRGAGRKPCRIRKLRRSSWVQSICHGAVSYDALIEALPLDRELLQAILDDAAHDGNLVDENGAALPALAGRKAGLMNRLFGR